MSSRSRLIPVALALAFASLPFGIASVAGLGPRVCSAFATVLSLASSLLVLADRGRAGGRPGLLHRRLAWARSAGHSQAGQTRDADARVRELEIQSDLARAERQAADEALARMKNEFTSLVSHELRTPLAAIKAYVEMLIDGEAPDPPTQREFYDVIQNEANRLGRLIDNVLNISRIEAGLVRARREPLNLIEVLRDAVETIGPHARQKRIALNAELPSNAYETLADRDLMYQAVVNLLSNAVKYTPEGGRVRIESEVDEARKVIRTRIIDTGVGIPPKDLPFVFDKFYRAEANNRIAPGTGLGLSLVRHIVETVHGGRVSVESHVGQGSTFAFELDLVATDSLLCC